MKQLYALLLLLAITLSAGFSSSALAQSREELEAQINQRNEQIKALEREIAETQKNLDSTSKQRQTLQSAITTLDLARKKLGADIKLTQTKIASKDAEIKALGGDIKDTTNRIGSQRDSVAASLRELSETDSASSQLVSLLSGQSIGEFLSNGVALMSVRNAMLGHVDELSELKDELVVTKTNTESKRKELAVLKADLVGQQAVLDANKKDKTALLSTTKNQESAYQALLKQKKALHEQFENDLRDFEGKLNLIIDPNSLPKTGTGVLKYPLDKVIITQYFGNTAFATKNSQIYNGGGHNAIDMAASPGTPVKSARMGVVKGTGDTDLTCSGASYGRWVLIEHDNGLSTLYAHLSVIRVSQGQSVATGEVVAYSGNTGYSTGPHLHFSVYATQGVRIQQLPSKASACRGRIYTMPVADTKAYLNPLSYL